MPNVGLKSDSCRGFSSLTVSSTLVFGWVTVSVTKVLRRFTVSLISL